MKIRVHRAPLLLSAALRVGDAGAGRSAATRSCWPPIAPRRWAAGRWWSASPPAIRTSTTCDAPGRYTGRVGRGGAGSSGSASTTCASCEPRYAETPHLRQRAQERAPRLVVRLADSPLGALVGGAARPDGAPAVPPNAGCRSRRRCGSSWSSRQPDVLLITPLIDIGSPQLDHFAAARALGIRTRAAGRQLGSPVQQGAPARRCPDRVLVWNQMQRQEARGAARRASGPRGGHRARSATTSGSTALPARSREDFCARVGLDPDRPFVLYTCSSLFRGTVSEPEFVEAWIRALRTSSGPAAEGHRHPDPAAPGAAGRMARAWICRGRGTWCSGARIRWMPRRRTTTSTRCTTAPASSGINTSAFIEAAAVGKPVHTVLLPEVSRDNQEGTLHFRYLLNVNGGLLRAARSLEEHVALLAGLAGAGGRRRRKGGAASWKGSCGPYGRGEAATPRFVAADRGGRHAAGSACASAGRLGGVARRSSRCIRSRPVLALHLRSQPWRKRTRHRLAKQLQTAARPWPCAGSSSSPSITWAPPASSASRRPRSAARR